MNIFKRKIKFVSAICPKCGGNLELDSTLETAYCQYCGSQCIVENAVRKKKETSLDKVIAFIERQQDLKRKDRVIKQKQLEVEKRKSEEWLKKYWWIFPISIVFCIGLSIVCSLLGL